ncbi:hypothetical protein [Actinomycetospora chiangmaiensis]|uniref:hypothetical protein n=1 Tax=Actinomycetospora chiangmaiensis TaxID=402650 RepID=UPI0003A05AFF|nr:hypothetical protein [Actinomycetospora chiangmaiensis]
MGDTAVRTATPTTGTRRVAPVDTVVGAVPRQRVAPYSPSVITPSPSAALPAGSRTAPPRSYLIIGGAVTLALLVAGLFVLSTTRSNGSGTQGATQPTTAGSYSPSSITAISSPVAPIPPPAASTVLVTTGAGMAADPAAPEVVDLLSRHFTAINANEFDAWSATVTPRRATSITRNDWLRNYATTVDSNVIAVRTRTGSDGNRLVDLSFVSNQAVTDAPPDLPVSRICWTSSWPLAVVNGQTVIDTPAKGATTKRAC